ncbi:MAG TPA: phytanoyl-CoA dioxygenase family protein, partial [Vicinamibacterales bacterium]|nr:phytanoyl-CoA dioxygenase family protein [Vicinamibacterales bacterium]
EIVEEYLGEPPVLLAERVWVRRHRAGRGLPWHQDAAFFGGEFRALNIWLAVTACGDDAPGLSVVARRFSRVQGLGDDEIPAPLHYGLAFSAEDIRRFAGNYEVANPRFEPGDALLFDEMTLHRTSPVAWRVPYKDAAVTWFFAPSRFPPHRTPLAF